MRAVHVTALTGPSDVHVVDVPAPVRAAREVLVAIKAVAPAFLDLLLSRGAYQLEPDLPFRPRADFAGVVLEAPDGSGFPGMRVTGCVDSGAAAEGLGAGGVLPLVHRVRTLSDYPAALERVADRRTNGRLVLTV